MAALELFLFLRPHKPYLENFRHSRTYRDNRPDFWAETIEPHQIIIQPMEPKYYKLKNLDCFLVIVNNLSIFSSF